MDEKIVLLPLTKKDEEGVNSTAKRSNHSFTTISGKKLLKEKEKQEETRKQKVETTYKKRAQDPYNQPTLGKCFKCDQGGHLSNEYRQCKTVAYVDENMNSMAQDNENDIEETDCIEPNGEDRVSCILQRALITPKGKSNPQSDKDIVFSRQCAQFMTKCLIKKGRLIYWAL